MIYATKRIRCLPLVLVINLILIPTSSLAWQDQARTDKQPPQETRDPMEEIFREITFQLAYTQANSSKDIEDKLQAAHMKADFALLMCEYGHRDTATELFKQSLPEAVRYLLENDGQRRADLSERLEVINKIAQASARCDPASKEWISKEIALLRTAEKEKDESLLESEPKVVPDDLWGTRPSIRRKLSAELLVRPALEKLNAENWDEAQTLLQQSLSFCVDDDLPGALDKLKAARPEIAYRLYLAAARQIQSIPSGEEVAELRYALGPLLQSRPNQQPSADAGNTSQSKRIALIQAYLNAMTALVNSKETGLLSRSTQLIDLIRDALAWYSKFQPAIKPHIEYWITEAIKRLPPKEQNTGAPESASQRAASLEEIVYRSVDAKERDQAYVSLISDQLYKKAEFNKASELASKISDLTLRRDLLDEIAYRQISFALAKGTDLFSVPSAIESISSPTLRVKLYIQLGQATAKQNKSLAIIALEDALRLLSKQDPSSTQSHLMLRVASVFSDFDSIRAFEALREAVKSINKHKDQPQSRWGKVQDDGIIVQYDATGRFSRVVFEDPDQYKKPYDFSAFRKLARADFLGTTLAASYISDKLTQASANYEICAAILLKDNKKQNKGASVPPPPQ